MNTVFINKSENLLFFVVGMVKPRALVAHSQGGYHCLFGQKVNWDKGGIGIYNNWNTKKKNRVVLKVVLHD